jgi:Family of unknown function (DUF6502)
MADHDSTTADQHDITAALMASVQSVLAPLAKLAVSKGLPHAQVEAALRLAYVQAAKEAILEAQPGILPHRMVSRISTVTGINRREVTRLTQPSAPPPARKPSAASAVFTRWLGDRTYRHGNGRLRALPRQGAAPSFESLAHSVTRDVHPRSILEELARLGLVRVDDKTDTVHIAREAFVPQADTARMLDFLGANVGDHFQAAVANVLATGETPHFEQAVWAEELSSESIAQAKALTRTQWQQLLQQITPELETLLAQDRAQGRPGTHRLRLGLFSYSDVMATPETSSAGHTQSPGSPS